MSTSCVSPPCSATLAPPVLVNCVLLFARILSACSLHSSSPACRTSSHLPGVLTGPSSAPPVASKPTSSLSRGASSLFSPPRGLPDLFLPLGLPLPLPRPLGGVSCCIFLFHGPECVFTTSVSPLALLIACSLSRKAAWLFWAGGTGSGLVEGAPLVGMVLVEDAGASVFWCCDVAPGLGVTVTGRPVSRVDDKPTRAASGGFSRGGS